MCELCFRSVKNRIIKSHPSPNNTDAFQSLLRLLEVYFPVMWRNDTKLVQFAEIISTCPCCFGSLIVCVVSENEKRWRFSSNLST